MRSTSETKDLMLDTQVATSSDVPDSQTSWQTPSGKQVCGKQGHFSPSVS
jgi:hypothetical protein